MIARCLWRGKILAAPAHCWTIKRAFSYDKQLQQAACELVLELVLELVQAHRYNPTTNA